MRDRIRQLRQAYRLASEVRPRLPLWLMLAALAPIGIIGVLLGLLVGPLAIWLPSGIVLGLLSVTIVFGRTVQSAQMAAMEGHPGAAAAVLQQMRGQWFVTPVVAVNRKQDMVHRAIGRCGVVLIGEGNSSSRVAQMLQQERTKANRISGDAPVHTVLVGDGEGETVTLAKLQVEVTKLGSSLSKTEVPKLARRFAGMDKSNLAIPKGYIPPSGGRPR